jgi:nucleoside-diphosphate-sugar epimerase
MSLDCLKKVLVTGASGFVGGRVVEALYLSGLATPLAAIRAWNRAARVARFPVEITCCDILDSADVHRAMDSVDAVVHCAYTDDRESIVSGTRNLLQSAFDRGVQRFVYLSSAEVYGPRVTGLIDETHPRHPTGSLYGDAKIEAEELCFKFARRGLPAVILRPSLIYGPFGQSWTIQIAKRLLSGHWGLFAEHGTGTANLVYVDDLVAAILRVLACDAAAGEAFHINGPESPSWNDYFAKFNEALGLAPLEEISPTRSRLRSLCMDRVREVTSFCQQRFRDPLMRVYLKGGVAGRWMRRLKSTLETTPSRGELEDLYSRHAIYGDVKARRILGFEPRVDLESGLALSVAWLRHHGYAPDRSADGVPGDGVPADGVPGNGAETSTNGAATEVVEEVAR